MMRDSEERARWRKLVICGDVYHLNDQYFVCVCVCSRACVRACARVCAVHVSVALYNVSGFTNEIVLLILRR